MNAWLHHGSLTGFPIFVVAVVAGLVIADHLFERGPR